jgi:hypothetical protein
MGMLLAAPNNAQDRLRLRAPEAIVAEHRLERIPQGMAALEATGMSAQERDLVLHFLGPALRPEGIATAKAREANAAYLGNYVLFRVCSFHYNAGGRVLAILPYRDNLHMPPDMRPVSDFYLLLDSMHVETTGTGRPAPALTRGPDWRELPAVRITRPTELYATYRLEHDPEAQRILEAIGLDRMQIDIVAYRSHERQWPRAIANFDDRYAMLKRFRRYRVKELARWDDKVLLVAPAQLNRRMPKALRPVVDLYFIYAQEAVERR